MNILTIQTFLFDFFCLESNSPRSDDRHSKEEGEHQSVTTTEDDEVQEVRAPHRSRFDDQDDDDEEEEEDNRNEDESDRGRHHRHRHHRHKRSRRHSSSTPASSSSKSAMTPPVSSNHPIEIELVEEKPQLPSYYPAIQGCRRVDEYSCLNRIEEGTYGVVFRAKDKKTGWFQ